MFHFFLFHTAVGSELSAHDSARIAADPFVRDEAAEALRRNALSTLNLFQNKFPDLYGRCRERFIVTDGDLLVSMSDLDDHRERNAAVTDLLAARSRTHAPSFIEHVQRLVATFVRDDLIHATTRMCCLINHEAPSGITFPDHADPSHGDTRNDLTATMKDVSAALATAHDARKQVVHSAYGSYSAISIMNLTTLMNHAEESFAIRPQCAPFTPHGCNPFDGYRAHDLTDHSPGGADRGTAILAVDVETRKANAHGSGP